VTVTLFVLGFGIGPLAFSPLSEMYGRQPIFFASLGLYFAFTFPSAFAPNAATLVVGRALAGISASAPMTVIGGTIADMWDLEYRGLPMALFSGTVFIGREWNNHSPVTSFATSFADFIPSCHHQPSSAPSLLVTSQPLDGDGTTISSSSSLASRGAPPPSSSLRHTLLSFYVVVRQSSARKPVIRPT
jgi:hypothetical protein